MSTALVMLCLAAASPRTESREELTEEALSCRPAAKPFFNRAWDALANVHLEEARSLFRTTLEIDPACTLAWAHLGALTPGEEGQHILEGAIAGGRGITEQERLQVRALAAQQKGDHEQALAFTRSALMYDPLSYRLNFSLAQRAGALNRWTEMLPAALKATELQPDRGAGWNQLGYAYLGLGKNPQAVAALKRYAQVAPMEPNAHDSLGDAFLANNQLSEARAAYQRALDTSASTFWLASQGVATVCAIQGDWACAKSVIDQARKAATKEDDRLALQAWSAWTSLAEGNAAEAQGAVDQFDLDSARLGSQPRMFEARLLRGRMLNAEGKYREALNTLTVLGAQRFKLENEKHAVLEAQRLRALIEAQTRLGRLRDAQASLERLQKLTEDRQRDPESLDAMAHARGMIALQSKDWPAAIIAFNRCSEAFDLCKLSLAEAQEKAGDSENARKTRAKIRAAHHRDPEYWWARTKAVDPPLKSSSR
jgi:tetratricopeptide (TPR) repeat protein